MVKVLSMCNRTQKKPKKQNISDSVSATIYSGSQSHLSSISAQQKRNLTDQRLDPEQMRQLREEAAIILHKPGKIRNEKKSIQGDFQDRVELFGQNFDSKYLGANKDEMHALLQQRSFRGLYTRLQFWVNLLMKHIYEKKEEADKAPMTKNVLSKYVNVLSFILFLRDVVLDVYENSTDAISDFEWNKHVRMVLEGDNKACIVECGG